MCFSHAKESSWIKFKSKFVIPAETLFKFSLGNHHFLTTKIVSEWGLVKCFVSGRLVCFVLICISQNYRHAGLKGPIEVTKCGLLFKYSYCPHQIRSPWLYLAESWQGCRSYSLVGYLLHLPSYRNFCMYGVRISAFQTKRPSGNSRSLIGAKDSHTS